MSPFSNAASLILVLSAGVFCGCGSDANAIGGNGGASGQGGSAGVGGTAGLAGTGGAGGMTAMVPRDAVPLERRSAAALGVPEFVGGAVTDKPLAPLTIPSHPSLGNLGDARIHNDVYNSGVYNRAGPRGMGTTVTTSKFVEDGGTGWVCAMSVFNQDGNVINACIAALGSLGVGTATFLMMSDPDTLEILAQTKVADRPLIMNSSGGGYFTYDDLGRVIVTPATNRIEIWEPQATNGVANFVMVQAYDVSDMLEANTLLQDSVIDWDGVFWFIATNGQMGYVDPATNNQEHIDLGEGLQNSMAVDESGVYVLTFEALYKFSIDDSDGSIIEEWRHAYDAGTSNNGLAPGSGTTPTLGGSQDDLIVIADNADTRINLLVIDRATGTAVCTEPLFRDNESGAENSVAMLGDDIVIPNNGGFTAAFMPANTIRPGLERWQVRADRSGCDLIWKNDTAVTNSAQISTTTGLIYGYGVDYTQTEFDAFYFTANDFETGVEMFRIYAGDDVAFDPVVGQPHLHDNGAAFVGTLHGLVKIADGP